MAEAAAPEFTDRHKPFHLTTLSNRCRRQLGLFLDVEHEHNYKRLADLVSFSYLEILRLERQQPSPTECLLEEWDKLSSLEPTVGKLVQYLEEMGRVDVLTDCLPLIVLDVDREIERRNSLVPPIQDATVSYSRDVERTVRHFEVLSIDDRINDRPTTYDAFVCYAREDIEFVRLLISKLEGSPVNKKLFIPGRDDSIGLPAYTSSATLIEERCGFMIVIISSNYIDSAACRFQTNFAFMLSEERRKRVLIPIIIERCSIPLILRTLSCCDYTRDELQDWFWKRLGCSI